MRVLIAVPAKRDMMSIACRESVLTQRWEDGSAVDTVFLIDGDKGRRWENLVKKLQQARRLALEGGYDALLTVESDIILPDDALEKLWSVDAPVVYGLFVLRPAPHGWNVATIMQPWHTRLLTFDRDIAWAALHMGLPMICKGHGQAVCMIRREVLEAIDFRLDKDNKFVAQDWCFSFDCQELGFTQMCHMGVACGHIDRRDGREVIYWPDEDEPNLYRTVDWGAIA